jgi:hypothetical protein
VVRDASLSADFGVKKGIPFIRVSETSNGLAITLLSTLAHEMIHLRQHLTGDREHHGPRFRRMAARVCAAQDFLTNIQRREFMAKFDVTPGGILDGLNPRADESHVLSLRSPYSADTPER